MDLEFIEFISAIIVGSLLGVGIVVFFNRLFRVGDRTIYIDQSSDYEDVD